MDRAAGDAGHADLRYRMSFPFLVGFNFISAVIQSYLVPNPQVSAQEFSEP